VRTYARTTINCLPIPWKPHRVELLGYFGVEIAYPHKIWCGFGLCYIILFHHVVTRYASTLFPCYHEE
jgi:hypothetical protein